MTINLSRRRFFAASAAGLVTSGLSTKVLASEDNAIHWDKTVDFLIVGTGFAGLAGALEAHYQGMKNILVIGHGNICRSPMAECQGILKELEHG